MTTTPVRLPVLPRPSAQHETTVEETLRRYWGYDSLRPLQREAIEASLAGKDTLVVLPTGGGKSLCYQVPPAVAGRTDIVVSPLISLMKDQVDALQANGYPAAALHSMQSEQERREIYMKAGAGEYRLLFVAPERLLTAGFVALMTRMNVGAFAIDEAHCISQWGHDFRPEYRQLAVLKQRFPNAGLHAYTATATPRVRADIITQLGLQDPEVLVGHFDRPNLTYRVIPRSDLDGQLLEIIRRHEGEAVIVYCISRKDAEALANTLRFKGVRAAPYHAGMEQRLRAKTQEDFAAERIDVVVATVAFGMGIDRSNVRCVVHAAMPKSVEGYQQETGRAGRDGLEAECVMLFSPADMRRWEFVMNRSAAEDPTAAAAYQSQMDLLREMQRFCETSVCRHAALTRYFGQEYENDNCQACDVCLDTPEEVEDAAAVARAAVECVKALRMSFGVSYVTDVLCGAANQKVRSRNHEKLPQFGLLKALPREVVQDILRQLVSQRVLVRTEGDRPVLMLGSNSVRLLKGELEVKLNLPVHASSAPKSSESWEGVDRGLFERLRELRREVADERGVPAFVVFGDATLRELARLRPSSLATFKQARGVGEQKLLDLGPRFVGEIVGFCADHHLEMDTEPSIPRDYIAKPRRPSTPSRQAYPLFERGMSLDEAAATLGRARSTVSQYLEDYITEQQPASVEPWVGADTYARVEAAAKKVGGTLMKPVFDALGGQVSYEQIRVVMKHAGLR